MKKLRNWCLEADVQWVPDVKKSMTFGSGMPPVRFSVAGFDDHPYSLLSRQGRDSIS